MIEQPTIVLFSALGWVDSETASVNDLAQAAPKAGRTRQKWSLFRKLHNSLKQLQPKAAQLRPSICHPMQHDIVSDLD